MGNKVREELLGTIQVDTLKSSTLKIFYTQLGFDQETNIYVIKDSTFNAFALPDNSIFVHDAALKNIETYQQLSALLAHEYAHIKRRHGMKGLAQAVSWHLLGRLVTGGNQEEPFVNSANTLLSLKSSRSFENEADMEAITLLTVRRIHPHSLGELMEKMLKLYPDQADIPSPYLSSHPSTKSRLERVNQELSAQKIFSQEDEKLNDIFREMKEMED